MWTCRAMARPQTRLSRHKSAKNNSDSERVALFACFSNSILKELAAEEELANYYHDLDDHLSWHEALLIGLSSGRKQGGANTNFLKNKPRIKI